MNSSQDTTHHACYIDNEKLELIDKNDSFITFNFIEIDKTLKIKLNSSSNQSYYIDDYFIDDQVIYRESLPIGSELYIYVFNNKLFWIKCLYPIDIKLFSFYIKLYNNRVEINQRNLADIEIKIPCIDKYLIIENFLTNDRVNININCTLPKNTSRALGKVRYGNKELIIRYHPRSKKIIIRKYTFQIITFHKNLSLNMKSYKCLEVSTSFGNINKKINLIKLSKLRRKKIFSKSVFEKFKNGNLLGIIIVNRIKYYIFLKRYGVYISRGNPYEVTQFKNNLKVFSFRKHFYIYGLMSHYAYNSFGKYDYLYAVNQNNLISKFKRPFRYIKLLKHFGYFKISVDDLKLMERVHYPLFLGTRDFIMHNFPLNNNAPPSKVYKTMRDGDNLIVFRTNIYNKATYSIVPYSIMYSLKNKVKIKLAKYISKYFYKNKNYNVNLFFEKQASKADESGIRVFEKVKEVKTGAKNLFILDNSAVNYNDLKSDYGKSIVKRFSFRHYLALFNSDYFISSDLSNHVINDRIYINSISKKIREVPLIFLQHGIMFAKPVENPLGRIFYKNNRAYNIYKSVVSSKLEANEFHKMGYSDSDLLYTGLSTFDFAKLDEDSNRIVYMPTYRYWEEGMIYSGHIDKTTYYKSILKVINAFEKAGLENRLMIVSHNKFSKYIYDSMPEYRELFGSAPSEGLRVGRIFITDYSSAIYDSIYRGGYPIFYWEDKDYLTRNYGAAPPVNEENAPGPVAKNIDELINIVKRVIKGNYKLEKYYQDKYKKINEFNDNQNTTRIVDYLMKDNII